MMTEPNLNLTRQHMEQLEFLVAQDIFINESGAFADVFLPATSLAEKEGTFTNTDRRVQRVRKAIEPRGQARADWEIICDLATRIEERSAVRRRARWNYQSPTKCSAKWRAWCPKMRASRIRASKSWACRLRCRTTTIPAHPSCLPKASRGARQILRDRTHARRRRTRRRVSVHSHHRALAGTLARRHDDAPLATRRAVSRGLDRDQSSDAAALEAEDGDAVRVSSRRGSIVLRAWVTQDFAGRGLHPHALCRSGGQSAHDRCARSAGQDSRIQSVRRARRARGETESGAPRRKSGKRPVLIKAIHESPNNQSMQDATVQRQELCVNFRGCSLQFLFK